MSARRAPALASLIPVRRKPKRQVLAFEKVTDVPYDVALLRYLEKRRRLY